MLDIENCSSIINSLQGAIKMSRFGNENSYFESGPQSNALDIYICMETHLWDVYFKPNQPIPKLFWS
jgi:hypothetical protein